MARYHQPFVSHARARTNVQALTKRTKQIVITNLFAKAPISPDHLTRSCESITAETSLLATTKVDIAVGLVSNQGDWNSSVTVYRDVTQAGQSQGSILDTAQNVTARSLQSGLITMAIKGSPGLYCILSSSQSQLVSSHLPLTQQIESTASYHPVSHSWFHHTSLSHNK